MLYSTVVISFLQFLQMIDSFFSSVSVSSSIFELATTDMTVEVFVAPEQVENIQKTADETGKSDWVMDMELKDTQGNVCATVTGSFQMRKS